MHSSFQYSSLVCPFFHDSYLYIFFYIPLSAAIILTFFSDLITHCENVYVIVVLSILLKRFKYDFPGCWYRQFSLSCCPFNLILVFFGMYRPPPLPLVRIKPRSLSIFRRLFSFTRSEAALQH